MTSRCVKCNVSECVCVCVFVYRDANIALQRDWHMIEMLDSYSMNQWRARQSSWLF
jgi:hypothetical protein